MASECTICGRERARGQTWWACENCPDVELDTDSGRVSTIIRGYCAKCARLLRTKRLFWIFSGLRCGSCGQNLRKH